MLRLAAPRSSAITTVAPIISNKVKQANKGPYPIVVAKAPTTSEKLNPPVQAAVPVSPLAVATSCGHESYTFGIGDRFAHQGEAQLRAFLHARVLGIEVCPVWNKSNREHLMIGSKPDEVRAEADAAVTVLR